MSDNRVGMISDDGRWRWDGQQWQPAHAGQADRAIKLPTAVPKAESERGLPMDKLHSRAETLLSDNLGSTEAVLARIKGADSTQCLVLTDQRALIIKVGWRSGQTLGGKVTSFDYANITSVEVRTSIMTGSFEIATGGVQGRERSYWTTNKSEDAWRAPNTIPILKSQQRVFQQVAAFIRERSRAPAETSAIPLQTVDIPDQLRKLAELRDQGIVSDAEFEVKKTELLQRM
jgi:hypothetical protein